MTRHSAVSGKTLIALFKRIGFEAIRYKGSHTLLKHPYGRAKVLLVHKNEALGPGLLASILRDVKLSRTGLQDLL